MNVIKMFILILVILLGKTAYCSDDIYALKSKHRDVSENIIFVNMKIRSITQTINDLEDKDCLDESKDIMDKIQYLEIARKKLYISNIRLKKIQEKLEKEIDLYEQKKFKKDTDELIKWLDGYTDKFETDINNSEEKIDHAQKANEQIIKSKNLHLYETCISLTTLSAIANSCGIRTYDYYSVYEVKVIDKVTKAFYINTFYGSRLTNIASTYENRSRVRVNSIRISAYAESYEQFQRKCKHFGLHYDIKIRKKK